MTQTKKTTIRLNDGVLKRVDGSIKKSGSKTRNEFFNKAVEFYLAYLYKELDTEMISSSLDIAIRGNIQQTEDRIASILYKQAVNIAMMMNVIGYKIGMDDERIELLRLKCIKDVNKTYGKLKFEDVIEYQRD